MLFQNIDRTVYETELAKSRTPSVLCFFKNTVSHQETVGAIEEVSHQFESVCFYTAQGEALEFFFEKFHFWGTPIFIFLNNGLETGRLIGTVTAERLGKFISTNIGHSTSMAH